jgi:hypothetical protein
MMIPKCEALIQRSKNGKQLVKEGEKKVVTAAPPGPTMKRKKGRLPDGGVLSVFSGQCMAMGGLIGLDGWPQNLRDGVSGTH